MLHASSSLSDKIKLIMHGTAFVFALIVGRLLYLQINLSSHFVQRSTQNCLRTENSSSPRGNILDRNGKLLATNRPVIQLYWQGTGTYFLNDSHTTLLRKLEAILNTTLTLNPLHRHITHAERHYKELLLTRDISLESLSKIEECFPNHPNISIKTDFQRLYPYSSSASHLLGYLSSSIDIEPHGKMGLEKLFEECLKGQHGSYINTVNSVGRKLAQKEITAARVGKNIQTTIDISLQQIGEKVFSPEFIGAMIIIDPANGDILAVISRPTFDPNMFLSPIPADQWKELQEQKPFLNRAFNASYPPGSIFKLITVSAALEHNMITPETEWTCKGFINFGNRQVWCHNKHGHGRLNTTQAIAHSCNIVCYDIGRKIDVDVLAHYARIFGFGEKTHILFPELNGLVPTKGWKRITKNEPWWPGETLSVSIGQSFLLVTPIQVAVMISSIFTGHLTTPRLLSVEPITHKPLAISPETRLLLQQSMKLVVTTGTGKQVNTVKDYVIHAKTSTAQTSALDKRTLGSRYLEHGWFVAHLQYKDTPPLTIVIVAENSGSSKTATIIAKNFLLEFKKKIDQERTAL